MTSSLFKNPDAEGDRQQIAKTGTGGKKKYWKPKPGDNVIRILPARADAPPDVNYHLKISKHILQFGTEWESFVCAQETYGHPDPVCEKRISLLKAAKENPAEKERLEGEARRYRSNRAGLFNIIDCADVAAGVQVYECAYAVWYTIVKLASNVNGKYNDIILKRDEKGNVVLSENGVPFGRQVLIYYNPKETNPGRKYEIYPDDLTPLAASKEQLEQFMAGVTHLQLEKLYPEISYEDAKARTFGTPEERAKLRSDRMAAYKAAAPAERDAEPAEQTVVSAPVATPVAAPSPVATPVAAPVIAPVVAPVAAPAPVPAPAPAAVPTPAPATAGQTVAKPSDTDALADVKRRVAALRNKAA
jgi:hypothetical protein